MSNKRLAGWGVAGMLMCTAVVAGISIAAPIEPSKPVRPQLKQQFDQLLKQLDDDDWRVREAATEKVAALPADALPLVEDALRSHNLSPEVQNRLSDVIGNLRRRGETAARTDAANKMFAVFRDAALKEFDRTTDRSAKWNSAGRDALVKQVSIFTSPDNRKAIRETADQLRTVTQAGCRDPLIAYWLAEDEARWNRTPEHINALRSAATALLESQYSPAIKIPTLFYRAGTYIEPSAQKLGYEENQAVLRDLNAACALFPQLKGLPLPSSTAAMEWAVDLFTLYRHVSDMDEKKIADLAALLEQVGQDPTDARVFEARALLVLADRKPETAQRNSVAYQQWPEIAKAMRARAASIGQQCVEDHPKSLPALRLAMRCAAISGNDGPLRKLYDRAKAIDPLDYYTRSDFAEYLVRTEQVEEALALAEECYQTQAFTTRIPMLSVKIPIALSQRMGYEGQKEFLKTQRVWNLVERGFREHFRVSPQKDTLRSEFAFWSCVVEKWDLADEQFQIVGKDLNPQPFVSSEVAFYMAKKAKKLSGK